MRIGNGKDIPLNQRTGTFPDVGDAMLDWFQPMVFGVVVKTVVNAQVVEDMTEVSFQGVWQPLSARRLQMKPEGQQAWSWFWLHADPSLNLEVDNIIRYTGTQYRVAAKKDYRLNGYVEYELVQDYTGAGPTPVEESEP